jgi:hypothetical protein
MSDRLDALLSAKRDGALGPGEETQLEQMLAVSESARARALEFERVDERLRALASEAVSADRLARIEASLARRLEVAGRPDAAVVASASADEQSTRDPRRSPRRPPIDQVTRQRVRRRTIVGSWLAAAVAAGLLLATLVGLPRDAVQGVDETAGAVQVAADESIEARDLASLGLAEASDLEVIEELELLEFLAARERDAQEPQG